MSEHRQPAESVSIWEVRQNPGPYHNLWLNGVTASASKADLSYLALAIRGANLGVQ